MESSIATSRTPRFVRWALTLGIVVVLNLFFAVILSIALPAPDYNAYCPSATAPTPQNAADCDSAGGTWTEYPTPAPAGATKPVAPSGYCDLTAKCQVPFQNAVDAHALYAFVAMMVFGIASLFVGFLPLGSSAVANGLSYGGVVALVIGSASYWGTAGNWLRLIIAAIALGALMYVGVKKFRD